MSEGSLPPIRAAVTVSVPVHQGIAMDMARNPDLRLGDADGWKADADMKLSQGLSVSVKVMGGGPWKRLDDFGVMVGTGWQDDTPVHRFTTFWEMVP